MNGRELRQLIEASGLSYQEVADELGVSKNLISLQTLGKRRITPEQEAKAVPFLRKHARDRVAEITDTLAGV